MIDDMGESSSIQPSLQYDGHSIDDDDDESNSNKCVNNISHHQVTEEGSHSIKLFRLIELIMKTCCNREDITSIAIEKVNKIKEDLKIEDSDKNWANNISMSSTDGSDISREYKSLPIYKKIMNHTNGKEPKIKFLREFYSSILKNRGINTPKGKAQKKELYTRLNEIYEKDISIWEKVKQYLDSQPEFINAGGGHSNSSADGQPKS